MHLPGYLIPCLLLIGCSSVRQPIQVHNLPNYEAGAPHQILFLDFSITQSGTNKPEQVNLLNAIVGAGEMKPMSGPVRAPYQIKLIRYYTGDKPPEEQFFEHPLARSIEVATSDGTLSRTPMTEKTGPLSVRFPYATSLTRLELYSLRPDQPEQKIYTLSIKP